MDREPFIGLWDMYCGWVHSELLLQTDGTYNHSLWGNVQSHWGVWSLVDRDGQTFLTLELRGAQPQAYPSLLGMVPMSWPSTETWAVTTVQPDDIWFYHAHMRRRAFAGAPALPSALLSAMQLPTPPPIPAFPQIPAMPAPPVMDFAQMPAMTLPPPEYSAPPPPLPPDAHQSQVMAQWLDSVNAAQEVYAKMVTDSMRTTNDINVMEQRESNAEFRQHQQFNATLLRNSAVGAAAFNRAINPSRLR
jgi:hypothetical protein